MSPMSAAMFTVGKSIGRGTFKNATLKEFAVALGIMAVVLLFIWISEKVSN